MKLDISLTPRVESARVFNSLKSTVLFKLLVFQTSTCATPYAAGLALRTAGKVGFTLAGGAFIFLQVRGVCRPSFSVLNSFAPDRPQQRARAVPTLTTKVSVVEGIPPPTRNPIPHPRTPWLSLAPGQPNTVPPSTSSSSNESPTFSLSHVLSLSLSLSLSLHLSLRTSSLFLRRDGRADSAVPR